MSNIHTYKIEAVVLIFLLIGTVLMIPVSSIDNNMKETYFLKDYRNKAKINEEELVLEPFILDRNYEISDTEGETLNLEDFDDAGNRRDAGDKINRATPLFPGESIDNTPGRGKTGKLSSRDDEDWYFFSVCEGQTITVIMNSPYGYDFDAILYDGEENIKDESRKSGTAQEQFSYIADETGYWYLVFEYIDGPDEGQYTFDVILTNQNDAGTGNDAGNSFETATRITPGQYNGYLDINDEQDWYNFQANAGQGIHFNLEMKKIAYLSDFDISLYNPGGEYVYEEDYYYDDELLYPADESGIWTVKIDIFPGYTDIPQSTDWDYYTYGSGAYKLDFNLESNAPALPDPIPQPQITPIAKSFNIQNDPNSNKDEYGYLASIPACNYLNEGKRYLAPIFYEGDHTLTDWFETGDDVGTVQDTVQYLRDDWETYLASHSKTALEYNVPSNPIEAAAEIATQNWESSDLAVIAVDGSGFEDNVEIVLEKSSTYLRETEEKIFNTDDPVLQTEFGYTTFLGKEWGAVTLEVFGIDRSYSGAGSILDNIFPGYINAGSDDWPSPYDEGGDATDIYFPVTTSGIWSARSGLTSGQFQTMKFTKISGDRYNIKVDDPDSVLSVKLVTDQTCDLFVFLIDPDGNLRAPDVPYWSGPVNPIHEWNGFHDIGYDEWRAWNPKPHDDFDTEVLHPETGTWTAIVTARYTDGPDCGYTITGEIKHINKDRSNAAISAANAAVIASQEHAPLLYVTKDSIPSDTSDTISQLGVNRVIFVERGEIGKDVKSQLPTLEADLTKMQEIVDYIKEYSNSENYITVTSIKTGDGYFAPSAMIAAYHCSPVLRIGEAPTNPAGIADRIESWRLWSGDFYHGSRAPGHLPDHNEPLTGNGEWTLSTLVQAALYALTGGNSGSIPPFGMDAKRYWNEELHDGIANWIDDLELNLDGQEVYCFVAPRKDIYLEAHSVMLGNNSYSGHIPGITPAYTSALVVRNVLYPALIFANPNRDIALAQLMNFPDGGTWKTNDGITYAAYSSRELKKTFGSHFRTFEGHCLWEAHLDAMNKGASVMYYSGHGTGGSGISAQYYTYDHGNYPDQIWWDAWRGYSYDNWDIVRGNGRVWYNAHGNMIYDIIHYNHVDRLTDNLMSNAIFYMSCSTGDAFGPMVYLDHGAVLWYGNAGSGLCPEADLQDDNFFKDAMIYGEPVGQAYSHQVWLHFRDFTTKDPSSMYGPSSVGSYSITTVQVIYGDPNLIVYSPEWSSPIPVDA